MKSKMSFFNPTLLKKNISRFAPAWGIFVVLLLLVYPMGALRGVDRYEETERYLMDMTAAGPFFAFFSALLFVPILFKYLHKSRAAYMIHAFPLTRTCLFVTNLVSGLAFFLVPVLLISLLNIGIFALRGIHGCTGLVCAVLGKWALEYLLFYGLAVFCMFLSGSQVISILSYVALNFVLLMVPAVFLAVVDRFFYGFNKVFPDWLLRLSPLVGLVEQDVEENIGLLSFYACVGVGLMGLGWLFYQKRHVERAGDAMVFSWAQQIFRLVLTFCVGLYLGFGFATLDDAYFLPVTMIGLFLGWFGATMTLERTVKVFKLKKAWLGYGIFVAALLLVVGALHYDVLGWQRRVPETDRIESVEVWTGVRRAPNSTDSDLITLTEADQIEVVRQFHSRMISAKNSGYRNLDPFEDDRYGLHIEYHLKDGSTLCRSYNCRRSSDLEGLAELFIDGKAAVEWYEKRLPLKISRGSADIRVKDPEYGLYFYQEETRYCSDGDALRAAILADAAAGRLPMGRGDIYEMYFDTGDIYMVNLTVVSAEEGHREYTFWIPSNATQTLALFGTDSQENFRDGGVITLDAEQSWFSDYEIRGNQVLLTCMLTLENESMTTQIGSLYACFPQDVGTLVQEERLPGLLDSEGEKEIPLDAPEPTLLSLGSGQTVLRVVFMGTYAGGTQKHDRLLPELYWYRFDNSDEEIILPIQ
ncbi:MAG: hypothetical protein J5789_08850 [Oscillospiraceae bacterium]|nr:hypothetical protein [Oscillospiraceae bacterium]